jgi:hypothetical protein
LIIGKVSSRPAISDLVFGILPHIFKILKIDVGPYTRASDTIGFWMKVKLEKRRRRR